MIDVNLVNLAKRLIDPLMPRWMPAPKGSKCKECGSEKLRRSYVLAGGPWSGTVKCDSCGFVETVMSYVGRTCISIEPLDPEDIAK